MSLPRDQYERRRKLGAYLPWVGTIHSLAYRLAGRPPVIGKADITAFLQGHGGQPAQGYPDGVEDAEGYEWSEPGRDEVEQALSLYAMARHRLVPISEAFESMPWGPQGPQVSPERAEYLAREYEDFKQQVHKIDYEDMLLIGGAESPPVDVCLADEVQDNSPLLWSVQDTWAQGLLYVMAGDPYQALYIWSGAEPRLFIDHQGNLVPLGDSRRLTPGAAERAQLVLRASGFEEREWLGTWTGLGEGLPTDGSAFWLARTGRLIRAIQTQLEDEGIPYGYLRGGGPLERKEARAYRVIHDLRRDGWAYAPAILLLSTQMQKGWLPWGERARLERLARSDPEYQIGVAQLEGEWGAHISELHHGLGHGAYYEKIYRAQGLAPFGRPPATLVGTIHAAKGREADTVHLVTSWGSLPYRAIYNGQAEAEACVAYVGLSRHRSQLILEGADEGSDYPGL